MAEPGGAVPKGQGFIPGTPQLKMLNCPWTGSWMGACALALDGFAALVLLRGKRGCVQAKESKYSFHPEGETTFLLPVRTKDTFDVSSQVTVWLLCSCVCSSRLCVAQTHSSCLCVPAVKGVDHQSMKVFPQSLVPFMLHKLLGFLFFLWCSKMCFSVASSQIAS